MSAPSWLPAETLRQLSLVYKLVEVEGRGRIKLSPGKKTYPLGKQVYRRVDANGRFREDHVTMSDELAEGTPLLVPIVRNGGRVAPLPSLESIRERCRSQLAALPEELRGLTSAPAYSITYSDRLEDEARKLGVKNL